jgi:histidyl-tRNA synthetase
VGATVEVVRGMRDLLPEQLRELNRVRRVLEYTHESYGYMPVAMPIVEHRDLYTRKLGEDLVGKVYAFSFGGRDLALRPEWTASVLRAYVDQLQDQPLPLRLAYSGPVFRYERPQRHTYRQFHQLGVELIGGTTPRADAEVLALACSGLSALGLTDYQVVIGHIGLIREILAGLGLAERTQGLLAWSLERLRGGGTSALRNRLDAPFTDLPLDPALLAGLDDDQANMMLLRLLPALGVDLSFGTRPPAEIIARLVRKMRREEQRPRIEQALALIERLAALRGHPHTMLPRIAEILAADGLHPAALADIRAILALLAAHGVDENRIVIDPALGRGLHYYTGLIFEIYDATGDVQLCGGGRYDDLVTALGGRHPTPAVGFAYGLERVLAACAPATPAGPPRPRVLVAAVGEDDYAYALDIAAQLRSYGFIVSVDVRERNVAGNLRDAARRDTRYLAIVGPDERAAATLVWRDLLSREEQRLAITDLRFVVEPDLRGVS